MLYICIGGAGEEDYYREEKSGGAAGIRELSVFYSADFQSLCEEILLWLCPLLTYINFGLLILDHGKRDIWAFILCHATCH